VPTWLAVALAAVLGLVGVHRAVRRDLAGALMAAGMAAMPVDMLGPGLVHGPWWAAGFGVVALWPLVRGVPVCGGRRSHLLCGLAMAYMCAVPSADAPHPGAGSSATSAASGSELVTASAHRAHQAVEVVLPGVAGLPGTVGTALPGTVGSVLPGAVGTALALLGWGLALYFLLGAVSALTRRDAAGALAAPRPLVLGEAAMALGSVVMLVAFC
jgi:hypothetical protein